MLKSEIDSVLTAVSTKDPGRRAIIVPPQVPMTTAIKRLDPTRSRVAGTRAISSSMTGCRER